MEPAKTSQTDLFILSAMSGVTALPTLPRPKTMKALELRAYDGVSLVFVSNKPVPTPGPREVLVRVHTAPISAPDLMFLQGRYGEQDPAHGGAPGRQPRTHREPAAQRGGRQGGCGCFQYLRPLEPRPFGCHDASRGGQGRGNFRTGCRR